MARKQKQTATGKGRKKAAAGTRSGAGRRSASPRPPPPPVTTLREELLEMGRSGARSLEYLILTVACMLMTAGALYGIWSLRPTPGYASEAITDGSPFDVTFRVANQSPWFPLANLKVSCVLASLRGSGLEPTLVEASDVRFPGGAKGLLIGEEGTFRCPFRALIGPPVHDDPETARRAEIYFRASYDVPLLGSVRLTYNSMPFVLNTRVLPPRWTPKPAS